MTLWDDSCRHLGLHTHNQSWRSTSNTCSPSSASLSPEHAQLIRLFVEMVLESSTLAVLLVCSRLLAVGSLLEQQPRSGVLPHIPAQLQVEALNVHLPCVLNAVVAGNGSLEHRRQSEEAEKRLKDTHLSFVDDDVLLQQYVLPKCFFKVLIKVLLQSWSVNGRMAVGRWWADGCKHSPVFSLLPR